MIFQNPKLIGSNSENTQNFSNSKANHFGFGIFMVFKDILFPFSKLVMHVDELFCHLVEFRCFHIGFVHVFQLQNVLWNFDFVLIDIEAGISMILHQDFSRDFFTALIMETEFIDGGCIDLWLH